VHSSYPSKMRGTLFWSLVALNVLDVLTTKLLLDRGATESNPLLVGEDIVTIGLYKTAVLLAIWSLIRRVDRPWIGRALYGTVITYAIVIGINTGGLICLSA